MHVNNDDKVILGILTAWLLSHWKLMMMVLMLFVLSEVCVDECMIFTSRCIFSGFFFLGCICSQLNTVLLGNDSNHIPFHLIY
jgi:hypothetical protein